MPNPLGLRALSDPPQGMTPRNRPFSRRITPTPVETACWSPSGIAGLNVWWDRLLGMPVAGAQGDVPIRKEFGFEVFVFRLDHESRYKGVDVHIAAPIYKDGR